MKRKWLDLTPWRKKPDSPRVGSDANGRGRSEESKGGNGMDESDKDRSERKQSELAEFHEKMLSPAEEGELRGFPVDMLPPEDVYMAAGIMRARGHGVKRVVEMLHSEHIRGLSKEIKRAAVLMAMEAAGITIEQMEKDAKARQEALDSYEAQQNKHAEAEWANKAEENTRIEAEMERAKAVYRARIARNDEGVARQKSLFNDWQSTKRKEVESMAEAVELCAGPKAAEAAEPAPSPVTPVASAAVPPLAKAAAAGADGKTSSATNPS